jgi:hypothetical protein
LETAIRHTLIPHISNIPASIEVAYEARSTV